jgi:hypothetical protein
VKDLTGQVSGRLTARWPVGRRHQTYWLCSCSCGKLVVVVSTNLSGYTKSCGCIKKEQVLDRNKSMSKHGACGSREYVSYISAKARCNNPKNDNFVWYGGRGIRFLFKDFQEFIEHIGPRPDGMSLDRINADGNYEPGNVRWADAQTQRLNQRPGTRKRKEQITLSVSPQ